MSNRDPVAQRKLWDDLWDEAERERGALESGIHCGGLGRTPDTVGEGLPRRPTAPAGFRQQRQVVEGGRSWGNRLVTMRISNAIRASSVTATGLASSARHLLCNGTLPPDLNEGNRDG